MIGAGYQCAGERALPDMIKRDRTDGRNEPLLTRAQVKDLARRTDAPAQIRLIAYALLICATGSLIWASEGNILLLLPASFLHGIVLVHLFSLQHECTHNTAFKSGWANRLVSNICGWLTLTPPLHFLYEHTDHHTHTQIEGDDPELIKVSKSLPDYLLYLSAIPYWAAAVSGILRRSFGRLTAGELKFVPPGARGAVVSESRLLAGSYCAVAIVILSGWHFPLQYWLIPLMLGQPVMRFVRMTEHAGCPMTSDPTQNTRSTLTSWPIRFLCWNMNYHAEHHLAPNVPFHALPKMHSILRGRLAVSRGYIRTHFEILRQVREKQRNSMPITK